MDLDPTPPAPRARDSHLHIRCRRACPTGRRRPDGSSTACRPVREHRGHPAPVLGEQAVADCVDAAVDLAQPSELQSAIDRVIANAKL